jgi:hypothetical protein
MSGANYTRISNFAIIQDTCDQRPHDVCPKIRDRESRIFYSDPGRLFLTTQWFALTPDFIQNFTDNYRFNSYSDPHILL